MPQIPHHLVQCGTLCCRSDRVGWARKLQNNITIPADIVWIETHMRVASELLLLAKQHARENDILEAKKWDHLYELIGAR